MTKNEKRQVLWVGCILATGFSVKYIINRLTTLWPK